MNWIDCATSMPNAWERVLIHSEEGVHTGYWDGYNAESPGWSMAPTGTYAGDGLVFHVTHWMPLPELPKK